MKRNILYVLVVLLGATQILVGQNSIIGNIKDAQTKENLVGVSLYISELKTGTTTNQEGNYQLKQIKNGIFLVEVSFIGYKKRVQRIHLTKDTVVDFLLYPSVSELQEVVVTAVTRSTELKWSPVIIKPVDMGLLNQNSSTNLVDALKNIPGVNQITTGAGISKPVIRGLGYNRVITLYQGIRQEGQQWGDEHGVEVDEYSIDRVEIVKGSGSLMYGSDGIAGVLNFILPNAPQEGKISTRVISNYQTNNQLIGYSIANAGNLNGLQWLGRISNKYAGNYQNSADAKVYNSGFQEYSGSLFLGVNKSWGYSHLHLSSFTSTLNMVEGNRDSAGKFMYESPDGNGSTKQVTASENDLAGYQIGYPHQSVNHFRVISNNYFYVAKGTIHFDVGFQKNIRKEFGDVLHPEDADLYFDLQTINYSIRYNMAAVHGWETSVGMGGMFQNNTNKGIEFLIPEYRLFDLGGFVFTQKTFNQLTLAGGFRVDGRHLVADPLILDSLGVPVGMEDSTTELKFKSFNRSYTSYSGSIGITYQLNPISTLKFNLSRGFRAPNIAELSSNGKHEGSLRYEYGAVDLNPEVSHQFDLAYFLNSDHITLEITPFVNWISNYIYSQKISGVFGGDSIPDPADPAPAFQFTQGNATLIGGEIYMDIHPHPFDWLHIENSFGYVYAIQQNQTDSTKYLPFIPAPKYRGELKAQFAAVGKKLSNLYGKIGIDIFLAQNNYFKAYNTETATPAYLLLNAGFGVQVKAFKRKDFLCIYGSIENIADIAYQSHLSRLKYAPINPATGKVGVFNMGRNISLKLIFNF